MCDFQAVKAALDAWLIPDVVQIKCEREVRLPGHLDYTEGEDDERVHHSTLITMKTPQCHCGTPHECLCEIWVDLGSDGVEGQWALSELGFPRLSHDHIDKEVGGWAEIEYRWPR